MAKRSSTATWARLFTRGLSTLTRQTLRATTSATTRATKQALRPAAKRSTKPPGTGDWISGVALGPGGARRYKLYRPPAMQRAERLPLLVMLHGCGQDALGFALSTRMNGVAARQRFLVLYPEQDRLANAQGCWNWFDTRSGRAQAESALILQAIDQACLLHGADRERVAIAGLSAGASMAALLAIRHPDRFKAVVMHSGVPPGTAHSALSALGAMRGRRATRDLPAGPPQAGAGLPPLLVVHGSADGVVAPCNGQAAVLAWADAAGARAAAPRAVQRGQRRAMTVTEHRVGRRSVATLVDVQGLGHAWSGGAAKQAFSDASGPDASRLAWAFAAKQFKPAVQPGGIQRRR